MTRYTPCLLAIYAGDDRGGTVQMYMLVIIEGVGSHLCVALCVTGSTPLCLSVRDNDGSITVRYRYNRVSVWYASQVRSTIDMWCMVVIERLSWVLLCLTCQKMDQDWDHPCVRVLVVRIYKTNTQTPVKRLTKSTYYNISITPLLRTTYCTMHTYKCVVI